MGLKEYRRKRDLTKTPEPPGTTKKSGRGQPLFVIQKHKATRLHYDLRLEMEGVLRSWAVPKGPSLDPAQKRLAVQVEDHPLEYSSFEGVIPEGQYGGGRVIVWDRGHYQYVGTERNAVDAWEKGKLEFRLFGKKLNGVWLLVRTDRAGGKQWLLFKKKDEFAKPGTDITADHPESVLTGRKVDEVEEATSAQWNARLLKLLEEFRPPRMELNGPPRPMRATLVNSVPKGERWLYELKHDGVRALTLKKSGRLELYSRGQKKLETQFPDLVSELEKIHSNSFCLDGEIVVLDEKGRSRFQLLQPRLNRGNESTISWLTKQIPTFYFVFDVTQCEGYDLRKLPLRQRRVVLQALLGSGDVVRISEGITGRGAEFFELACQNEIEGIVAKDLNSPYEGRRSPHWLKAKCLQQDCFVVGGYTRPERGRKYFGALLVGIYEDSELTYVGKIGSGFSLGTPALIHKRLKNLETDTSPFARLPRLQGARWVKPQLVCRARFTEWTRDGKLRAPVFLGIDPDYPAQECVREVPRSLKQVFRK
ncbi:MAG: hypothetical protein HY645_13755 [Acidobacteria bacterium]|nr:hypothetical protein [Acidobacteriota bacterium]